MKHKSLVIVAVLVLSSVASFALSLDQLLNGHSSLAREIRKYERQGYYIAEGDNTYYSQYRYFAQPVAPYTDGAGTVTLIRKAGEYSLKTEYITIRFTATVEKENGNRFTTDITDVTYQVVH